MRRLYMAFLRAFSANHTSLLGVILTTSAFILFILFEFSIATGWVDNAYLGLISFLALPLMFLFGLFLMPFGWWLYSRKRGRPFMDLFAAQFSDDDLRAKTRGARVVRFFALMTLINILFLGIGGTTTIHYMEGPKFCGTACHAVMSPEWTTYQESPHSHVKCVECHVGEGFEALINSKLNGMWQMASASLTLYDRPIPTPVHNLRPARETCEKCHWPDKFHGNLISNRITFKRDSSNTPQYTTLMLKIGSGAEGDASGSHWHISAKNEVRYSSVEDKREEMIWVDVRQLDGSWKRFHNTKLYQSETTGEEYVRMMDCLDCHNRATHIYERPGKALDNRMERGEIDRTLPFIKRKGLEVLTADYPDKPTAQTEIGVDLKDYYHKQFPELFPAREADLDNAIAQIQAIYDRNIFPQMNITWGSYKSHLGHQDGLGCFRCHNSALQTEDGESIPMQCTLCHSILADESAQPFAYLQSLDMLEPGSEATVQKYFQEEFRRSVTGQENR